jgi:hypothetical protein
MVYKIKQPCFDEVHLRIKNLLVYWKVAKSQSSQRVFSFLSNLQKTNARTSNLVVLDLC